MECTTVKPIELTRGNNVEVDVEIDGKLLTFIIVGTNIIFCFRYTTLLYLMYILLQENAIKV